MYIYSQSYPIVVSHCVCLFVVCRSSAPMVFSGGRHGTAVSAQTHTARVHPQAPGPAQTDQQQGVMTAAAAASSIGEVSQRGVARS